MPGPGPSADCSGALPGTAWMQGAACASRLDLPWTVDRRVSEAERRQMSGVCAECPVFVECDRFATAVGASAGFWAGRRRDHSMASATPSGEDASRGDAA